MEDEGLESEVRGRAIVRLRVRYEMRDGVSLLREGERGEGGGGVLIYLHIDLFAMEMT